MQIMLQGNTSSMSSLVINTDGKGKTRKKRGARQRKAGLKIASADARVTNNDDETDAPQDVACWR